MSLSFCVCVGGGTDNRVACVVLVVVVGGGGGVKYQAPHLHVKGWPGKVILSGLAGRMLIRRVAALKD